MSDESRRFTDREVALVLRRASEMDLPAEGEAASGLSLNELREIAKEVGITTEAIDRAVASLDRGQRVVPGLAGAPRVRKAVHAVPGELDQDGIARLMRLVDERTDNAGTISEALGSVRWTGQDRLKSTRISVTPRGGETTIEVVEKAEPRLRRILHLVPASWGLILAPALFPTLGGSALAAAGIFAGATAVGAGVGRAVWTLVSAASGRRVRRLAEGIATEATTAVREGQVQLPESSAPSEAPELKEASGVPQLKEVSEVPEPGQPPEPRPPKEA